MHAIVRWLSWCSTFLTMLVALHCVGCGGSSKFMAKVPTTASISAPADKASVVFVRPSGLGFLVKMSILDQQARWLGDAVAKAHFAVELPPGEYMFVGWAENTAALKATLAPGKVYYVKVEPKMGLGSARVDLEALTARHPEWAEVQGWLGTTKRLMPLPTGVAYIEKRRRDADKRVRSARENWNEYTPADKDLRTLRPEDGVGAAPAPEPASLAAPAP